MVFAKNGSKITPHFLIYLMLCRKFEVILINILLKNIAMIQMSPISITIEYYHEVQ